MLTFFTLVRFLDLPRYPGSLRDLGYALGPAGFEQLDHRGRPCVMSAPATPPVWKVRMVSWVPGSPMDCAAICPDRLTDRHQVVGRQRAPVAQLTHPDLALAAQHGADLELEVGMVDRWIERGATAAACVC